MLEVQVYREIAADTIMWLTMINRAPTLLALHCGIYVARNQVGSHAPTNSKFSHDE